MADPIEKTEETVEPKCKTFKEFFFYKIDRTLAIIGIVLLSGWALYLKTPETIAASALGIGALATYIGNRAGK